MNKLIFLSFFILLFIGCEKDVIDIIQPVKTKPTEIQGVRKFIICHLQEDGIFAPLGIDILELNKHLAHGDFVPDKDEDGYTAIGACYGSMNDCDDDNAKVYPNAEEICGDGIDNNCDGNIDEDCAKFPNLIEPLNGDLLDNGCLDRSDTLSWYFAWEDFPGATCYQLYVKHATSSIPVINKNISRTNYLHSCFGAYITNNNRTNWYWKVRAKVNNSWTEWSEPRVFDVEKLNTDC